MTNKNVPELRFEGFKDDWEQRKLGELLNEIRRPVKIEDHKEYQLVTVKRRNGGVISRGKFKGKDILVKNYFELKKDDKIFFNINDKKHYAVVVKVDLTKERIIKLINV